MRRPDKSMEQEEQRRRLAVKAASVVSDLILILREINDPEITRKVILELQQRLSIMNKSYVTLESEEDDGKGRTS